MESKIDLNTPTQREFGLCFYTLTQKQSGALSSSMSVPIFISKVHFQCHVTLYCIQMVGSIVFLSQKSGRLIRRTYIVCCATRS